MNCDYCNEEMPPDCKAIPSVIIFDGLGKPLLYLHAECISTVVYGLQLAERMVMN